MEFDKKTIVDIDGVIENGKQFDLDLKLPEDNRDVIYGIVKDACGEPVCDAVVKLVEICHDERKPVSHTITDKDGEFVFGPLCPNKSYSIEIWVNRVKHIKICKTCDKDGKCLKGVDIRCEKHDKYEMYNKDCNCENFEEKKDDYNTHDNFEKLKDDKDNKFDKHDK